MPSAVAPTDLQLDLPGGAVRCRVLGSGPPLVLCHGFMGSAENFDGWLPALTGRRTVVIPDLPGSGASPPLAGVHTCAALAEVVAAVMRAVDTGPADVGGLCLGVPVATALAAREPGLARRLILHTPLLGPAVVRRRFRFQVAALTAPGIYPPARRLSRSRVVSDLYKRLVVEGNDVDPAAARVNFENQLRADDRALREWLRDGIGRDGAAPLAAHRFPALLLAAADDRIVDPLALACLAGAMPGVELYVDPAAGHGWTVAAVERQVAVIAAFLDRPLDAGRTAA